MHPLVLFHGFTGAPASFERLTGLLAPGLEVFAPSVAGHTLYPPRSASFAAEVERLAAEIETHCAGPCHLAGYSLGGRLALGVALEHPEIIASLTLISSHPGLSNPDERRARIELDEERARTLELSGVDAFLQRWEAEPLFASQRQLPTELLAWQREIRRSHQADGLARSLRTLGLGVMPDYGARLREIAIPVTLVTGQLDAKFVRIAAQMREHLPSAGWIYCPNVGHNVILEAEATVAEHLNRLVSSIA